MNCTVLLVDDHQMMRDGLRMLLDQQDDLQVVGEASDGRSAIELARKLEPDIVVMDVAMPDMTGIEATRELTAILPSGKIIALSMHDDKRYVLQMLKAGAVAYLLKNSASDELIRAIRAVNANESFLSPGIASTLIGEVVDRDVTPSSASHTTLSNREREVLELLANGLTSKVIASELRIAVRTIETHRREIMRKLDLHSVAELTKYALREGLTSLDP